ncbi:MAG TPA: protein-glutamate O-methyltransferase [Dongiaceae bacterium]|nr:protein-glutamate O-methyltransferase [Dongiaceae bacterium]
MNRTAHQRTAPGDVEIQLETGAKLSDEDYNFISRLVYEKSRIHLGKDKKVLVASRLAKRLRQLQLPDYRTYCHLLRSPAGDEEMRYLIDRISTNHTHFLREIKHFDFLRDHVLPQWAAKLGRGEPFRLWSAASSSGEEAYSIAMYLAEYLTAKHGVDWRIEGTDISTRVLEIARAGVYADDRLAAVSTDWKRRFFQKGVGNWEGHLRVREELRQRVNFHHLNLLEDAYPFPPFQVIFCRNVMIYFDRPTQETLVARLAEKLIPGGHLMVGHSESLNGIRHTLKLVQPAIYVKPA